MQSRIKKKIVALIMARGGSKSIPDKNIVLVNGYPLISWSIAACKLCKKIDEIIVSTDSEKIKKIALRFGAQVPFYRPSKIAGDKSTDFEAFDHFINWWKKHRKEKLDLIVQIRPTTPYREPAIIDEAIKTFQKKTFFTGLRSVYEMSETSWKTFEIGKKNDLIPLTNILFKNKDIERSNLPRQALPKTYFGQGYVDIVRPEIIEKGQTYGKKVYAFITPDVGEIDSKHDLKKIKKYEVKKLKIFKFLKYNFKNNIFKSL